MDILGGLSRRAADSKIGNAVDDIRMGWNSYSFVFYIGAVAAILGGVFGLGGTAAAVITVFFFYYTGKFKKRLELEKRRRERYRKSHPKSAKGS